MPADFVLIPHPERPWLLSTGRRSYTISPALGHKLSGLDGRWDRIDTLEHLTASESAALRLLRLPDDRRRRVLRGGRFIWLRLPLLNAAITNRVAGRLRHWTSGRGLLMLSLLGLVSYAAGGASILTGGLPGDPTGASCTVATLLFLVTAVWHEFGHAAALRRGGFPAGGIGFGMLLLIPVLYCDVTAVGALPRRDRLRVDAAGIVFQSALGGVFFAASGLSTPLAWSLQLAGLLVVAAIVWSLLPFMRTDGYWLLCDLLELRDLESPIAEADRTGEAAGRRWRTGIVLLYRLLHTLFLGLVCLWLPWRLSSRLPLLEWIAGGAWWLRWPSVVLVLSMAGLVGLVWYGVVRRVIRMARATRRDWGSVRNPLGRRRRERDGAR